MIAFFDTAVGNANGDIAMESVGKLIMVAMLVGILVLWGVSTLPISHVSHQKFPVRKISNDAVFHDDTVSTSFTHVILLLLNVIYHSSVNASVENTFLSKLSIVTVQPHSNNACSLTHKVGE